MSKGFTLIELIVVTGIIVLITALTLPNYKAGERQFALQRSAHKLSQDLRRAQQLAISAEEFEGQVPSGYGIYLNKNQPTQYILFVDLNSDGQYSGLSEIVEEINLEKRVKITELNPIEMDSSLTITFRPPDPATIFYPDGFSALVTLEAEGLETTVVQYTYHLSSWWIWGWKTPRADCDLSSFWSDCPDSFPSSALEPLTVYDQWWLILPFSKRYSKEESEAAVPTKKTIQVNKAGLIDIE